MSSATQSDEIPMPPSPPRLRRQNAFYDLTVHAPPIVGTIYRLRPADGRIISAVLTKKGTILEVKNSTGPCGAYDTLLEWVGVHYLTLYDISSDTTNSKGLLATADTHGCIYPLEKEVRPIWMTSQFSWLRLIFEIVYEACPQLLDDQTFKTKYNALVELCDTHNVANQTFIIERYDINRILPQQIYPCYYSVYMSVVRQLPKDVFDTINNLYTSLRSYIIQDLTSYLNEKNKVEKHTNSLKNYTSELKCATNKYNRHKKHMEKIITNLNFGMTRCIQKYKRKIEIIEKKYTEILDKDKKEINRLQSEIRNLS